MRIILMTGKGGVGTGTLTSKARYEFLRTYPTNNLFAKKHKSC